MDKADVDTLRAALLEEVAVVAEWAHNESLRRMREEKRIPGGALDWISSNGETKLFADRLSALAKGRFEAALPECVGSWRGWATGRGASYVTEVVSALRTGKQLRLVLLAADCLEWLATAPASAVARLGLRGDALRAVREWQECSKASDGQPPTLLLPLRNAQLFDVDALMPLLRAVKKAANQACFEFWPMVPPEWQALVDGGEDGPR